MPVNSSFQILKSERGQNLVSLMVAVGLIAILALFASSAVSLISNTLREKEGSSRLAGLDQDIANLLVIPSLCTCNFAGKEISKPDQIIDLTELRFYSDPPLSRRHLYL